MGVRETDGSRFGESDKHRQGVGKIDGFRMPSENFAIILPSNLDLWPKFLQLVQYYSKEFYLPNSAGDRTGVIKCKEQKSMVRKM